MPGKTTQTMTNFSRFVPFRTKAGHQRSGRHMPAAERYFHTATPIVFALFLLFGGGGAPHAVMLVPLQVLGLMALLALAYFHFFVRPIPFALWPSGIIFGGLLLLGLLQLLPLPYDTWTALPGRELAAAITHEAGLQGMWHPWSLAPEYSKSALLTLLPAVATYLAVSACNTEQRLRLARTALVVALLSAALAVLQFLTSGDSRFYLSPRSVFGSASGIFANRNFQADLLILGILMCLAVGYTSKTGRDAQRLQLWPAVAIGVLALMTIATQSRFGFVLLFAALLIAFVALGGFSSLSKKIRTASFTPQVIVLGSGILIAIALLLVLFGQRMILPVLTRFGVGTQEAVGEMRIDAIPDLVFAATRYFPLGAGLGTFDPVYRGVESLELVSEFYFNHAHNDYFELLIETGLFGLLLVLVFLVAFAVHAVKVVFRRERKGAYQALRFAAVAGIALLLIHSVVDYPLRTVTLQCLFAFLAAVLFAPVSAASRPDGATTRSGSGSRRRVAIGLLLAAGVWSSVVIAQIGIARQAVLARAGVLAYQIRPENPAGTALAADAALQTGNPRQAERLALLAIEAFPIDAVAVRVLGQVRNASQPGEGDALLRLASLTGWRERATQSWVVERGLIAGNFRVATMRAEALARLRSNPSVTFAFMRILTLQPDARAMIVRTLSTRPSWRRDFLYNDDPKTPEQLTSMKQLLLELGQTGAPPTLDEARPVIDGLVAENRAAEAFSLYRAVAPERAPTADNLLSDSGFDLPAQAYQPGYWNSVFDWRVWEAGQSLGTVEPVLGETGNTALFVGATRGENGRLAERYLALPPGRYRLTYRARAEEAEGVEGLFWIVRCADVNDANIAEQSLENVSEEWQRGAAEFVVPIGNCPAQVLSLGARDIRIGTNPAILIDDVVLRPVN